MAATAALVSGITNQQYHDSPWVGSSMLKQVQDDPLGFHHDYILGRRVETTTPAKRLGTMLHTFILEPNMWESTHCVIPTALESISKRTSEGKEAWEAFYESYEGFTVITQAELDDLHKLTHAVHQNEKCLELLSAPGVAEQTLVWQDELGIPCKARIDWLPDDFPARPMIDIKTTKDSRVNSWRRDVGKFGYHVQNFHYACGMRALGFEWCPVEYVVIDTTRYHAYARRLSAKSISLARRQYESVMMKLLRHIELNDWLPDGYGITQEVDLMSWDYN